MEEIPIPITGLEELESHLQRLVEAPDIPLDAKLFDEVELQLTGNNKPLTLRDSAAILTMYHFLTSSREQYTPFDTPTPTSAHANTHDLRK